MYNQYLSFHNRLGAGPPQALNFLARCTANKGNFSMALYSCIVS